MDREQAFADCRVAAPAYGNDLAACLMVRHHWPAADAQRWALYEQAENELRAMSRPRCLRILREARKDNARMIDTAFARKQFAKDSAHLCVGPTS